MKDKQHITIHIADVAPLDLSITADKEEVVRRTVTRLNELWSHLSKEFKGQKSSHDVLAMVAFQYARAYYELRDKLEAEAVEIAKAEKALDEILLDVNV